jgi:hypothetical protein
MMLRPLTTFLVANGAPVKRRKRTPSTQIPIALLGAYVEALVLVQLFQAAFDRPESDQMRCELLTRARRCAVLLSDNVTPTVSGNVIRFRGLKR